MNHESSYRDSRSQWHQNESPSTLLPSSKDSNSSPKLQWLPTLSPKSRVPESIDSTWLQHQDPLESVQHGSRSTPACTHVPPLVLSSRPVECLLWRWPNLSHKIQPPRWRNDTLFGIRSFEHNVWPERQTNDAFFVRNFSARFFADSLPCKRNAKDKILAIKNLFSYHLLQVQFLPEGIHCAWPFVTMKIGKDAFRKPQSS